MPYFALQPRYYVYIDTVGDPLDNGYVYIGDANLDPELYPAKVSWDDSGLYPVEFPVRTRGGYLMRGEYPGQLFINIEDNEEFSVLILEEDGTEVFSSATGLAGYWPSDTGGDADTLGGQLPSYYATNSLVVHLAGAETITGNKNFTGVNTFSTTTTYFGVNGGGNSQLAFWDDTNNEWRILKWDDSSSEWQVEDTDGLYYRVWHTGNDTNLAKLNAANIFTASQTIQLGLPELQLNESDTLTSARFVIAGGTTYVQVGAAGAYETGGGNLLFSGWTSSTDLTTLRVRYSGANEDIYHTGINPSLGAGNGVSGSIDTTATQTITVTNGIITAIA